MRSHLPIACAALLAVACQRDSGAPSAEQSRDLDEAAEMLNQAPANLQEIDDSALVGENGAQKVQ